MDRIEAANFHDIVQVSEPRVAPGGETVAFVRTEADEDDSYERTVYMVPTGGGEPQRFTLAEGTDSEPRFSPDGDRLAFVSTRGDGDLPQLWVLPTDGGEAQQVTDVVGGVNSIEWSPDGESIVFCQQVSEEDREEDRDLEMPEGYEPEPPDPRVIERTVYRSMQRYFDGKRNQVYLVDVESEDVSRVTETDLDHGSPTWQNHETLYFTRNIGDPDPDDTIDYAILEYDRESDEIETLLETTAMARELAVTADGRIAHPYTDPAQTSLQSTELHVLDTDGEIHHPTAELDRTLGYECSPQWGPDEETLFFSTPDEGADSLWTVQWDESDPDRIIREDWSSLGGAHIGDDVIAFVKREWDHPGDVFVATTGGAEQHRLTRVNADYLEDRAVSQPEEIRFEPGKAESSRPDAVLSDGDSEQPGEIHGWVLTPPDFDADEQYPLAVEVHGGPHIMWTTSDTMWHEFQTLAARGYVVFWSNPRGSAGYGDAFRSAIERAWGEVTTSDVLAGVDTVADRSYVDEESVFLTGGSFGGYLTSWIVGQSDRFDAAVSQRGVYDLTGFYGSTDAAYKLVEGDFDATPWEDPEFLHEHSPVGHAHNVSTPTLIMHGDEDYRTPASTAELFYRILRKHGVETRFVRYGEEGHELSRSGQPAHIVDRIERIVRWFDGYSEYHDVPPALERNEDAGLSAAEDADDAADEDETDGE
jgi:dipeptidyl aminopeptidase/acylaminoacyl peptidase